MVVNEILHKLFIQELNRNSIEKGLSETERQRIENVFLETLENKFLSEKDIFQKIITEEV